MKDDSELMQVIIEEMRSFSELGLKNIFRSNFLGIFESLIDYTKDSIENIENKVLDSINTIELEHDIFVTLMNEKQYRLNDDIYTPIFIEDILERGEFRKIRDNYWEKNDVIVKSMYINLTNSEGKEILNREFHGYIDNYNKKIEVIFSVRKSKKYNDIVKKLYSIFLSNRLKWKTINMFYSDNMYDIVIKRIEGDLGYSDLNLISEIYYDLEEFSEKCFKDHFLVWNIRRIDTVSVMYPEPIEDSITYRHTLSYNRMRPVLVSSDENEIFLTYRDYTGNINIISDSKKEEQWSLYEFISPKNKKLYEKLDFKVYSNKKNETIFDSFDQRIRTVGEINRIINSYETLRGIKVKEIISRKMPSKYLELENLNSFIISDFNLDEELRQDITLKMEKSKNMDHKEFSKLMSFIVSELEYIYPEFRFMVVDPYD